MKNKGTIAILGGMGPKASAKMLEVMVSMASDKFKAKEGDDFPEIIVDSVPVPDFISNKKNINKATEMLIDRVKRLERFGISNFAIACNTAHIVLPVLTNITKVPFVSMIDCVVGEVRSRGFEKVGIMATPTTLDEGLYQFALERAGIEFVLPTNAEKNVLEKIIRRVIAGHISRLDEVELNFIAESFKRRGAQVIILGCTELPLVVSKDFPMPYIDSIEVLSQKLLEKYYMRIPKL